MDYTKNITDYISNVIIYPILRTVTELAQLLCVPVYNITGVNVVVNSMYTLNATPLPDINN